MIDPTTHLTISECSYHWATSRSICQWVHHTDSVQWATTPWVDALPLSYISLHMSMGPSHWFSPMTHNTISKRSYHWATFHSICQWVHHTDSVQWATTPWVDALPLSYVSLHMSMGPSHWFSPMSHNTMSGRSTTELHLVPYVNGSITLIQSNEPQHHEWTLYHWATFHFICQWVHHTDSVQWPTTP